VPERLKQRTDAWINLQKLQAAKPKKITQMKFTKITGGKTQKDHADEMCKAVNAAVYGFAGKVPLATAIGVLSIAQHEILDESK